jgi:hypothetical protein
MTENTELSGNQHTDMGGSVLSSADEQEIHERMAELNAEELAHLPILAAGAEMENGEAYLDLDRLEAGPFAASGNQRAERGSRIVAKRDLDLPLWQKLTGG